MATTYSKITYDGKKVQVDSAIRDGNGKQIDTNYQEKLVSGTNIKTVNGNSLLGSGDITIQAGGGSSIKAIWGIYDGTTHSPDLSIFESGKTYKTTFMGYSSNYIWRIFTFFKVITSGSSPSIVVYEHKYEYYQIGGSTQYVTNKVGITMANSNSTLTFSSGVIGATSCNVKQVRANSNGNEYYTYSNMAIELGVNFNSTTMLSYFVVEEA